LLLRIGRSSQCAGQNDTRPQPAAGQSAAPAHRDKPWYAVHACSSCHCLVATAASLPSQLWLLIANSVMFVTLFLINYAEPGPLNWLYNAMAVVRLCIAHIRRVALIDCFSGACGRSHTTDITHAAPEPFEDRSRATSAAAAREQLARPPTAAASDGGMSWGRTRPRSRTRAQRPALRPQPAQSGPAHKKVCKPLAG
jgi:hypothetical protein